MVGLYETRPGDVVWVSPGEKRWHCAAAKMSMTHMAIEEQLEANAADCMENVTEEQ